tara:strand:- start:115 stop:297 length:183 start_codon:yes stop_codon:yes gene_type:complete
MSAISILLFDIYTETKIKVDKTSNNAKGTTLALNIRDHKIAIIELREIIICKIRINGYVC